MYGNYIFPQASLSPHSFSTRLPEPIIRGVMGFGYPSSLLPSLSLSLIPLSVSCISELRVSFRLYLKVSQLLLHNRYITAATGFGVFFWGVRGGRRPPLVSLWDTPPHLGFWKISNSCKRNNSSNYLLNSVFPWHPVMSWHWL